MQTPLVVDRASPVPLHRQIYDQWRSAILAGRFRAGEKLPSTRELAAALAVSRITVTAAYDQLMAEGYFDTARGSGTFVSAELPDDLLHARRPPSSRSGASPAVRLSAYARRLEPPFAPRAVDGQIIDLSRSGPDIDRFPFQLWRRLLGRHVRTATSAAFEYSGNATGFGPLRREIAAYVGRSRAVRCSADQVIVVNGSQQALDLCARILLDPGDEVAVENPGYRGARQLFTAHGARLRTSPLSHEGIVLDGFSRRTRMVYVTPSHQLPMGVSMSLGRRLELLEWARPLGAVVLEDDYDSVYRYSGAPLPSLQSLGAGTAVIYVGTFSNVMFPGLRIGYLVLPSALVEPFARAKWLSDRQTTILEQAALADFLREGHFERHVRRMRRLYKRRREVMVDALTRHFGDRMEICGDATGMHMVIRLRPGTPIARGAGSGVHLASTRPYYIGDAPANEFMCGFTAIGERAIREGVKRLAGSSRPT